MTPTQPPPGSSALADRVAIVTGAASGIGRATARRLAADGATVVAADLDPTGLDTVTTEIAAAGGHAIGVPADLRHEDEVMALVDRAVTAFGRLDILHNNAAATDAETMSRDGSVLDVTADLFTHAMAVNLLAPLVACRESIPHMIDGGGGVIVNTSSLAGLTGYARLTTYSATKAGLMALTRSVATQFGHLGVRSVSVAVGGIATPAIERNLTPEQAAMRSRHRLTARSGTPDDVAAVVAFLASDAAAYINGETIRVDGGTLSHAPSLADEPRSP